MTEVILLDLTTSPAAASRGEDGLPNTGGGGGSFGFSGPGGSYADHRGGLGGSGMLVIAETEEFVSNTNMTIISDTFTANSVPNTANSLFAELPDGLSDFSISATRDNTTFTLITLTDTGFVSGSSGTKIYTGSTPLTVFVKSSSTT